MITVKPVVMFFVLLMIMVSSPFRWKVHLPPGNIHGGVGSLSDQVLVRKGVTKDRIILAQERKIQQLIQSVWNYRQQLQSCQNRSRIYFDSNSDD
ncbi:hypothetical protein ZOSMA_418G00180 [Zostera marina]|uniref:Uncharacterized protein n=1 Tax=Zostera marina TaxID=29655 RepID=A0A0K9P2W9_ZOSMR|nr:hypothetical protein ZOSMA_418G00180 [Zostera marina]